MAENLTPRETAELIGVSERTLANWRWRDFGPPWRKLGKGRGARVRYARDAVDTWLNAQPTGGEAA